MEKLYKEAFSEVLEVLNNSAPNIIEKIPKKFIEFLNENKDNDYISKIDFEDKNWENYVKKETQAILALIYRDYIVSPKKREKLLKEENEEQVKFENQIRQKYNPDDIFKNKKNNQIIIEEIKPEETAMVEYKGKNLLQKIFDKIKHLFNKN